MKPKRILATVLAVLGLASIAANVFLFRQGQTYFHDMNAVRLDPIGLSYYPSDAGGRALSPGERRVVLFGDSRALMWKEPTVPNLQFVNLGIGNQTTEQIIERLDRHVAALHPSIVVLQAGVNDLKTIPLFPEKRAAIVSSCTENIERMVTMLRALGATVVLSTIFPIAHVDLTRKPFWSDEVAKAVIEVNESLRALAARSDHVILFDAYQILVDSRGQVTPAYSADMLHLNPTGYDALNAKLVPLLTAAAQTP
jgi:lysophospholipase L1-like esterase